MLVKKALLENLKEAYGINIYEAKIYTALLSRGICSAGELADISGVPRSRCYDVLESLEKKGFVLMKIGKPIKYIANAPEDVLDVLQKQTRIEQNRLMNLYEEVEGAEVFKELKQLYSTGSQYVDTDELSTAVVGKQSINLFVKDMLLNAKNSVVIHTTKEGAKRKNKIVRKATQVKVDMHAPVSDVKNMAKNITLTEAQKPLRFVEVDGNQMLLFTSPHEADPDMESAVLVTGKYAVSTMKSLLK